MAGFKFLKKDEYNAILEELQTLKDAQASGENSASSFASLRDAMAFEGSDEEMVSALTEQLSNLSALQAQLETASAEMETLRNELSAHQAIIAERDQTISEMKAVPGEASASAADGKEESEPTAKKPDDDMPMDHIGRAARAESLSDAIKSMLNN